MRNAILTAGHELLELGYHLVPARYGTKRPLERWRESECSHALLESWRERYGARINLAIHAGRSGVVALDADTPEAVSWIAENCPETLTVRTPRGGLHAYFQVPEGVRACTGLHGIEGLEVKTHLLMAPPSFSTEHNRSWEWQGAVMKPAELPPIDLGLISKEPIGKPEIQSLLVDVRRSTGTIRDVTRWIMAVPSKQGCRGSDACFKVACRLADAGFSREEAMHWLRLWNDHMAEPPWSERELAHKLTDAFQR